jgi:hypothetical protein
MTQASARLSFHGPLLVTRRQTGPERVPAPPSASSVGRAVLQAARTEQPSTAEHERILAGVLAALQRLTSG